MSAPGSSKYGVDGFEVEDMFDASSGGHQRVPGIPQVRTLKPPPEIWELVHPVTARKQSPVMAFITRITSNGTTLMVLIFAALALGAISAFLIVRPDKVESRTSPKVSNVPRARPSQSGTATTAPATLPTNNQPTLDAAIDVQTPTAVTPDTFSQMPSLPEKRKVRPPKKQVPVSDYAIAEKVSGEKSVSQPTVEPKVEKKTLPDTGATKPKANASSSPQEIAPAKPTESPKAKVIQWP